MLKKIVSAGIILMVLFFSYQAVMASEVPNTLNYQGTLTDSGGQLLGGQYQIVFNLYETPTGGTVLWSETQTVTVTAGRFSVSLGNITTLDPSILTGDTYIGVTVGADEEMIPRQKIASVAYALKSGDGVPAGVIVMWSGAADQIPAGWALCDGNNGTPDLRNRFVVGAGSGYAVGATGGEATHTLTIAEMPTHSHGITDPGHRHAYYNGSSTTSAGYAANTNNGQPSQYTEYATTGISINSTGGGSPHNNLPPYYALAFIIKL